MALRPIEFHILVTLAAEERHGYAIIQEAERLGEGSGEPGHAVRIEPGTLYRALHRMLKDGWVAECSGSRRGETDERRKSYRLTPLGRRLATAEAERLSRLVNAARAARLLTRA